MCGVTGLFLQQPREAGADLHRMTEALRHRGPDGDGFVALDAGRRHDPPVAQSDVREQKARVFLGHRRLKVIDLEGSRQPLANETGTVWVTFNGEIYNFQELRAELQAKGHTLREAGDGEVLVHLWEEYGPEMVERLVGMFAFALYDCDGDVLFLARDRYGQKPLYYWDGGEVFAFASEIQGLWPLDGFPRSDVDASAAASYFRYGYVPAPRTIYRGVSALPPGSWIVITKGHRRQASYWRPRVVGTEPADLDRLETLLDEAVGARLGADVPLGAFLSGGIDSALVVASMARQLDRPVRSFTISTGVEGYDEAEPAAMTAEHLGTDHRSILVEPDLVKVAAKLARHYGQPFADYSSVPTYYVSRETRRHVTVALSGDGGDELFAGYQRYRNYRYTAVLARLPFAARRLLAGSLPRGPLAGLCRDFLLSAGPVRDKGENLSDTFHVGYQESLFTPLLQTTLATETEACEGRFSRYYDDAESEDPRERWLEVDQRLYLAGDILVKVDIASMAVSLECRSPMLDHRFAEVANRVRYGDKLRRGKGKHPLRRLAARRLPGRIVGLPKKGFSLPLGAWLRGGLAGWADRLLAAPGSGWEEFLRRDAVLDLWRQHRSGQADHTLRLWSVLAWILWEQTSQLDPPAVGE